MGQTAAHENGVGVRQEVVNPKGRSTGERGRSRTYLFMVAHYMAQARGLPKVHFALEQPASPRSYMPETVSFWDTEEWKQIKEEFQFEETTFEQRSLGGPSHKANHHRRVSENGC